MSSVETRLQGDIPSTPDADPVTEQTSSETSAAVGYLASIAMTAVATVVAVGIDNGMTIPNVSLVFVVPVIVAGLAFGLGPSLLSAVMGALSYNFFLTEPRYSLSVDDPANIWAIALLLLIGLIVSTIAHTSRLRAADAALLRRQTTLLHGYSRDVATANGTDAITSITAQALASLLHIPVVVIVFERGSVRATKTVGSLDPQEADLQAARLSLETRTVARAGIYPALASRYDFWPVTSTEGSCAVIGLAFDAGRRTASPDTLIEIVASVLALALNADHNSRIAR